VALPAVAKIRFYPRQQRRTLQGPTGLPGPVDWAAVAGAWALGEAAVGGSADGLAGGWAQGGGHPLRGVTFHPLREMPVNVLGDVDRRVTEDL